jgi:hypothetical protein
MRTYSASLRAWPQQFSSSQQQHTPLPSCPLAAPSAGSCTPSQPHQRQLPTSPHRQHCHRRCPPARPPRPPQRGNHFAETSIKARQAIAELGARFIRNGCVVLVHGHSRVVLALLNRAVAQVRARWPAAPGSARAGSRGGGWARPGCCASRPPRPPRPHPAPSRPPAAAAAPAGQPVQRGGDRGAARQHRPHHGQGPERHGHPCHAGARLWRRVRHGALRHGAGARARCAGCVVGALGVWWARWVCGGRAGCVVGWLAPSCVLGCSAWGGAA